MVHPAVISTGNSFGDLDIFFVSLADDGMVQKVGILGSRMHPCGFKMVEKSELGVGDKKSMFRAQTKE